MMQKNPALKQALIWGISLGIIQVIVTVLVGMLRSTNPGLVLILDLVIFIVALVFYLLAGLFAARQTHKVSTGTIAGLLTGVFQGVPGLVATTIITVTTVDTLRRTTQSLINNMNVPFHYTNGIIIAGQIIGGVIGLAFAIGLGAGLGALGGLIGRGKVQQQQPYMPYPPQPYPPYGAVPPYPYPPQPGQPYQGMPSYPSYPPQGVPPYPAQAVPYPYPLQDAASAQSVQTAPSTAATQPAPTNQSDQSTPPTTPLPPQE